MAHGDFKDLPRRTASDEVLRDKAFNIAKNSKYGYQQGLASMVYWFLDFKSSSDAVKSENRPNQHVAKEFHKPIIRKFEKRRRILIF